MSSSRVPLTKLTSEQYLKCVESRHGKNVIRLVFEESNDFLRWMNAASFTNLLSDGLETFRTAFVTKDETPDTKTLPGTELLRVLQQMGQSGHRIHLVLVFETGAQAENWIREHQRHVRSSLMTFSRESGRTSTDTDIDHSNFDEELCILN